MKLNNILVKIYLITILLLIGCETPGNTDKAWKPRFVKGVVIDSLSRQPIDSALVRITYFRDTTETIIRKFTDSLGQYNIYMGPVAGSGYAAIASHSKYFSKLEVFETFSSETTYINFRLIPLFLY